MNEGLNEFGSAGMEKRVFLFLLSFRKGKGGEPLEGRMSLG